jgi:hypothetical protein
MFLSDAIDDVTATDTSRQWVPCLQEPTKPVQELIKQDRKNVTSRVFAAVRGQRGNGLKAAKKSVDSI